MSTTNSAPGPIVMMTKDAFDEVAEAVKAAMDYHGGREKAKRSEQMLGARQKGEGPAILLALENAYEILWHMDHIVARTMRDQAERERTTAYAIELRNELAETKRALADAKNSLAEASVRNSPVTARHAAVDWSDEEEVEDE